MHAMTCLISNRRAINYLPVNFYTARPDACVRVCTVYAKALDCTRKNVHANFEISLISKVFKISLAEICYYCVLLKLFFVFQFQFCGDTGVMCAHFPAVFVFKQSTKLDRLKLVNSVLL